MLYRRFLRYGVDLSEGVFRVFVAIDRRSHPILFFVEFDEVRRVGEIALDTDLCNGFVRSDQQHAGMSQSLFDEPFVGRFEEVPFELLFE